MPVCIWASTNPGKAKRPRPSTVVIASPVDMLGAIAANRPLLMAISVSVSLLPCGLKSNILDQRIVLFFSHWLTLY